MPQERMITMKRAAFAFLCSACILSSLWACEAPSANPQPTQPGTGDVVPVPTLAPMPQYYGGTLTGSDEVPEVDTEATGFVSAVLNPEKSNLKLKAEVQGLSGTITGAHLHAGAAGSNGEVVKALDVDGNSLSVDWGREDAENPLTENLLTQLEAGELYVNVHTEAHPDGEIRTQLALSTVEQSALRLSGAAEVPPVDTEASAVVLVQYNRAAQSLQLQGQSTGLSGAITGAHIHAGAAGSNGEVVKPLIVNANQLSVNWTTEDAENPLTEALITQLEGGELYINVHTEANPDGEIRGQITLN